MKKLGIFYGTSTGNTEYVAKLLVKEFGDYDVHLADIARVKNVQLLEDFDYLILASSTWNFGDLQDDWMDRKAVLRSEEHTSELQSRPHLVCRLLLEKKKRSSSPAVSSHSRTS